jgi:hypothetical protein
MPTLTLLDDAMLRAGRMIPAINRLGGGMIAMAGVQPWRVIGSEAVIYQLRQSTGRVFALRCLLADTIEPALPDRYRALGADLAIKRFRSRAFSPVVGGVNFIADGISLPTADFRSARLPLIAMDWVMGPTLMAAIDRACRGNDQQYILALAEAWRTAMLMCGEERFVHGDLTGHNAMVRPKEGIALVDYDHSWWPTAPSVPTTSGRPGYRHPRGVPAEIERRDDFAALVVYVSLRVLAAWPELRFEYGSAAVENDGVILFSGKDLANPDGSALFGKIRVIDEPAVQALAGVLRETCRMRPEEIPSFREAIGAAGNVARTLPVVHAPARPSLDHRNLQDHASRLNGMLLNGNDDEAWAFWIASGLSAEPDARRELGPMMAEVERRRAGRTRPEPAEAPSLRTKLASAAIEQLTAAIEQKNGAAVARVWSEVRNEPAASIHAAQANQLITAHVVANVRAAIAKRDHKGIVAAAEEAKRFGVALNPELRRSARAAASKLATLEEVDAAFEQDDRTAIGQLAMSGDLDQLGDLSPEMARRVELARATPHLLRAIATDDDHIIDRAWDRTMFPDLGDLPVSVHNRMIQAHERVTWLEKARKALKARDVEWLRTLMSTMPLGSEDRLSAVERSRMRRLIRQDAAIVGLRAALAGGDDRMIVDALNEVEAAGALLPPDLNWATVRGVIDRLSLIASIRRAALAVPRDYRRLSRLLPQAREESTHGETPYLGGNLDFADLELDVQREAHRNRLLDAIERGDNRAIVAAAVPDPHGVLESLNPEQRRIVDQAVKTLRPANPLRAGS